MAKLIDPFGIIATEELQNERIDICAKCEHVTKRFGLYFCKECGCHVASKTKISKNECPINKW